MRNRSRDSMEKVTEFKKKKKWRILPFLGERKINLTPLFRYKYKTDIQDRMQSDIVKQRCNKSQGKIHVNLTRLHGSKVNDSVCSSHRIPRTEL